MKQQVNITKLHLVFDCKISSAQCELRNVALHLLLTPKLTFNRIDAYGGVFFGKVRSVIVLLMAAFE